MVRHVFRPGDRVSAEFLDRTRMFSVCLTALLCMWLFGNLYESAVWNLGLIADPRPGTVAGALAPGSPVYYYLPWTPLSVVLAVALRVRFGAIAPAHVRRGWNAAIGLVVCAMLMKVFLITQVNPVFRDPDTPVRAVRDQAVLWGAVNAAVIAALACAVILITAGRRPGG